MVDFIILNELSLPIGQSEEEAKLNIKTFIETLNKLKEKKITSVRSLEDISLLKVTPTLRMLEYLGRIKDRDFKTRMRSLITGRLSKIEAPLYNLEEEEKYKINSLEHNYHGMEARGLGACDIFEALSISFNNDDTWKKPCLLIDKEYLDNNGNIDIKKGIEIKNIYSSDSVEIFNEYFEDVFKFKYKINQRNFNSLKGEAFKKIKFCKEVEGQISSLGHEVFNSFLQKLILIELGVKSIYEFVFSGESESVKNNPRYKNLRMFSHEDLGEEKIYFDNHLKSFPQGNRMYFLEKNNTIYIGYIGNHLPTSNH